MKLQEQTFTTRARLGVLAGALLGLSSGTAAAVRAQGGPSVAPAFSNEILSALGLPEITLTQLEDGTVEGLPDELSAGTYLVTIASDSDIATYVNFVQPPDGLSTDAATAQMLETAAMDVPREGWVYGGGSYVIGEGEVSFAIDLEPGLWQIAISRLDEEQGEEIMQLFPLTITGESASPAEATYSGIPSNQILELRDAEFEGLNFPVQAGPSIWQVTNAGEQPRQVVFWLAPYQITTEEFQQVMTGLLSGTAVAAGFNYADLVWVGYAAILSPGQRVWLELDLPAADYLVVSYVLDAETQMPAFALGMVEPFTVVGESDGG